MLFCLVGAPSDASGGQAKWTPKGRTSLIKTCFFCYTTRLYGDGLKYRRCGFSSGRRFDGEQPASARGVDYDPDGACICRHWPARGFVDTQIRFLMEPEVWQSETAIQSR